MTKIRRERGGIKILLVGGSWTAIPNLDNQTYGRKSSLVESVYATLCERYDVDMYNGGHYDDLNKIINKCFHYDIVFWWANVPDNALPKIRDVKSVAPKVMLVTSKRNDGDKYNFMELTQHVLGVKGNLAFEFNKISSTSENKKFKIRVFDPLGCLWYEGFNIAEAVNSTMDRLMYLRSVTRQGTIKSNENIDIPDETEFFAVVREYAEQFYQIFNPAKDVKRFLGNASMRPPEDFFSTRCMRGMPSFKKDNIIFVSQRNVDKQFIDMEHFVPCYMENGKLYYCGDNKPSVDTPIQIRLYDALPNIRYIIHSHCYINGAKFTSKAIPCGAIEEVNEVLDFVDNVCGGRNLEFYTINLFGHGSLLMAKDVKLMKNIKYVGRCLPEPMF